MAHSILLAEERIKAKAPKRSRASNYPKWINEQSLMTVSILSFCTLLYFIGLHFAIVLALAVLLLLVQLKSILSFKIQIDISLNKDEVENSVAADLYLME